jgi:hypothetical protein
MKPMMGIYRVAANIRQVKPTPATLFFSTSPSIAKNTGHILFASSSGVKASSYISTDPTKGSMAMVLARLIASVNKRWCLAQVPEIRLGMILPRSVVKYRRDFESL